MPGGEHYPLTFPVNYALDRGMIVMRMAAGTKLAADHANVTFEVDEIDQHTRSGRSVLVRGLAEEVTNAHRAELIARTEATGVTSWAPASTGTGFGPSHRPSAVAGSSRGQLPCRSKTPATSDPDGTVCSLEGTST